MEFDRLQENNKQVDANVIKISLRLLPFSIVLAFLSYILAYSIQIIFFGIGLFTLGCLLPFLSSKLHINHTKYIAIISFTIISTTIYGIGVEIPGLLLLYLIPIVISCCYFDMKLLNFTFVLVCIGINIGFLPHLILANGLSTRFFINLSINIVFITVLTLLIFIFFKDLVKRTILIFQDVMGKEGKLLKVNEKIASTTNDLINIVKSLENQSSEASGSTEQMALEINDMLIGVTNQTNTVDEVYNKLLIIQEGIKDVQENVQKISGDSNHAHALANDGKILIGQSSEKDNDVINSINSADEKVIFLCSNIDTAFDLVNKVTQIAAQSKLLALNAMIEAAKAGESGKGFAVVADEVTKLAAQTTATATEVNNILDNLKEESNNVSLAMNYAKDTVEEGIRLSREVDDKFATIVSNNNNINDYIISLSGDVNKQLVKPIEIITMDLEKIKNSIHSHNNAINELASVSEELSAMTEGLNNTSAEVSNTSKSLEALMQ